MFPPLREAISYRLLAIPDSWLCCICSPSARQAYSRHIDLWRTIVVVLTRAALGIRLTVFTLPKAITRSFFEAPDPRPFSPGTPPNRFFSPLLKLYGSIYLLVSL